MDLIGKYLYKYEPLKSEYKIKSDKTKRIRTYKPNGSYSGGHGGWLNVFFEDSKGHRAMASTFTRNGIRYLYSFHEIW